MTPDELKVIELLRNPAIPENDLQGWIDCAGTLLIVEAVPDLVNILANERLSLPTRQHAANTIRLLGSIHGADEMSALRVKATPLLNQLLDLAETI